MADIKSTFKGYFEEEEKKSLEDKTDQNENGPTELEIVSEVLFRLVKKIESSQKSHKELKLAVEEYFKNHDEQLTESKLVEIIQSQISSTIQEQMEQKFILLQEQILDLQTKLDQKPHTLPKVKKTVIRDKTGLIESIIEEVEQEEDDSCSTK